jgi:uncharacterized protein (DUF427 family)
LLGDPLRALPNLLRAERPGREDAAARLKGVADYPRPIAPVGHIEPVPRRIRAQLDGRWVVDTTDALYVWEFPPYPQYLIPAVDTDVAALPEDAFRRHERDGYLRIEWKALDSWFEEDEEVFVHPRNPFARVDALRSTRGVRIELDDLVLAETTSPVMVFETGLPTRHYLNRTDVDFEHLRPSDTVTECPYKGRTSGYWSAETSEGLYPDLAWTYEFPVRQLLPIAGMIAFFDERVDVFVDGTLQERPVTPFS